MNFLRLKTTILTNVDEATLIGAWVSANSLCSHHEKEVRELALFSMDMMRELFPKNILDRVDKHNHPPFLL